MFQEQISMVVQWDVLLLQEWYRKMDEVNAGNHESSQSSCLGPVETETWPVETTTRIRPQMDCELQRKPDQWNSRETLPFVRACCPNELQ